MILLVFGASEHASFFAHRLLERRLIIIGRFFLAVQDTSFTVPTQKQVFYRTNHT